MAITESVMESTRPSLPELHHLRHDSIPTPEGGEWDLSVCELCLELCEAFLEHLSSWYHPTLCRGPGPYLTPSWPAGKVSFRLGGLAASDFSRRSDLPLSRRREDDE